MKEALGLKGTPKGQVINYISLYSKIVDWLGRLVHTMSVNEKEML